MLRVVIAEDSAILRDGLAALLARRGHEVVAAVADGQALVARVAELDDALAALGDAHLGDDGTMTWDYLLVRATRVTPGAAY